MPITTPPETPLTCSESFFAILNSQPIRTSTSVVDITEPKKLFKHTSQVLPFLTTLSLNTKIIFGDFSYQLHSP